MVDNGIQVREYAEGDETQIVELLELVFDGWPKFDLQCTPLEHWKWKYHDNPYGYFITLAEKSGLIIGSAHTLFKKMIVGSKEYLTGMGADAAVHSDYRGGGVFSKIRSEKDDQEVSMGLKFNSSVSSHPHLISRNYKIGNFLIPYKIIELNRIKNINQHYKNESKIINKYGYYFLSSLNKLSNVFNKNDYNNVDIKILDEFDDDADELWSRVKSHYCYIVVHDKEYLNWRYCDKRGGDYKVIAAYIDGKMAGYLVIRINEYDVKYPIGYIVDYIVDPLHYPTMNGLLEYAVNYFEEENINKIISWNVKNMYTKIFNKNDFLTNPRKLHVFLKKRTVVEEDMNRITGQAPEKIHFCLGDHDSI